MKMFASLAFFRYFAASLLALVVDVSIFCFAMRFLPWFWAAPIGFLVGAAVAYFLSVKWVFSARNFQNQPTVELAIFVVVGIAGLGLTELVLLAFTGHLGVPAEPAKLVAAACTFMFNYVTRKAILFSNGFFGFFQRNEVVR